MFTSNFYPTPSEVAEQMLQGHDLQGRVILEPQAGKGDLVKAIKKKSPAKVYVCEKHPELAKIAATHGKLLCNDFFQLKKEDIFDVEYIIMNPPFENAASHIMHAYRIAPPNCTIISLLNANTISNDRRRMGADLKELLALPFNVIELGKCFENSERKTSVEVACIELAKPGEEGVDIDWSIFSEEPENAPQIKGLIKRNELDVIINSFVYACKEYTEIHEKLQAINRATKNVGSYPIELVTRASSDDQVSRLLNPAEYMYELQIYTWQQILYKLKLEKYMTKDTLKLIQKFVDTQKKYPLTKKNVYKMFEVIMGTRGQMLEKSLMEAIDNVTRHTKENRYGVEGWATNSRYLLNRKFILGHIVNSDFGFGGVRINYQGRAEQLDELMKSICFVTGRNWDNYGGIYQYANSNRVEWGKWTDFEGNCVEEGEQSKPAFLEFRCYKKGTMHVRFKNESEWIMVNKAYAKAKGYSLPERF